jgi:membrane-associated protein
LQKTEAFYAKHGGKTIVLTRFIPIVRTYAPFVAGVGQMRFRLFSFYNVIGGAAWILSFLLAGYFFGNIPTVKTNFHLVIVAIIFVSILPAIFEYFRHKDS